MHVAKSSIATGIFHLRGNMGTYGIQILLGLVFFNSKLRFRWCYEHELNFPDYRWGDFTHVSRPQGNVRS